MTLDKMKLIIRKAYSLSQLPTEEEVKAEIVNLKRRAKKRTLHDFELRLYILLELDKQKEP